MAAAATENQISRSFEVEPGGLLVVDEEDGDIEVRTGESDRVEVEVLRRVKAKDADLEQDILDNHVVTFDQEGNTVTIVGERKKRRMFWNLRDVEFQVRYRISVPQEFGAELTTSDGNIAVDDLTGELRLKSSDGDIEVGDIRGDIRGYTSDGDISIEGCTGALELRTSDGDIRVERATGEVAARTSDGNIAVEEVRGRLEATTSDGDIEVAFAAQPTDDCRLKTSDGDIRIRLAESAGVDLEARTSDGTVSADFPVSVEGKRKENVLSGPINGGGPELYVKTSDGDIELKKL